MGRPLTSDSEGRNQVSYAVIKNVHGSTDELDILHTLCETGNDRSSLVVLAVIGPNLTLTAHCVGVSKFVLGISSICNSGKVRLLIGKAANWGPVIHDFSSEHLNPAWFVTQVKVQRCHMVQVPSQSHMCQLRPISDFFIERCFTR